MAGLYHINGDNVSPCRAQKGQCPYGRGSEQNHFSDPAEAMRVLETRLEKEFGAPPSLSKTSPIPEAPSFKLGYGNTNPENTPTSAQVIEKIHATGLFTNWAMTNLPYENEFGKQLRDSLRAENPGWSDRQVYTVASAMMKKAKTEQLALQAARLKDNPQPYSGGYSPQDSSIDEAERIVTLTEGMKTAETHLAKAKEAHQNLVKHFRDYDNKHGVYEGRAYYFGNGGKKIMGVNPSSYGPTFYVAKPLQISGIKDSNDLVNVAIQKVEKAQTAMEEAGFGHLIPDEDNTIRVRTQAQKWLLERELKGQISDGKWGNSGPNNHWEQWSSAKVIVDPKNLGRNFRAIKDNYQLNAADLLSVVGDRMKANVTAEIGRPYDDKEMANDLTELRKIFKTLREHV